MLLQVVNTTASKNGRQKGLRILCRFFSWPEPVESWYPVQEQAGCWCLCWDDVLNPFRLHICAGSQAPGSDRSL